MGDQKMSQISIPLEHLMQMTDDELIRNFRNGEKQAGNILVERYKQLVRLKARALYLAGGDQEDLLQEGMLGLFHAISDYEAGKSSFRTFASICISRQMYSAVEAASRKKHAPLNESISLEAAEMVAEEVGMAESPETQMLQQEHLKELLQTIESKLSPMERKVFLLFMEGNDYRQIADEMQTEVKRVDNALQRIKRKIHQ